MATPAPCTRPPPLSLGQTIRLHCKERLYVAPLHWTDHQLELLQCRFDEARAADVDACDVEDTTGSFFWKINLDHWRRDVRGTCVDSLLADAGCPLRPGYLACHATFHRRAQPDMAASTPTLPAVAHVDLARLSDMRGNSMRPSLSTTRRGRDTTWTLYKLKLQSIISKEPLRNPYLVTMLIAMT
ncbi:hypothetical protein HRG_007757 [Hirsutella rhossiliensis]|uniref:Uncharacterized protein n=1 Tax=Hirsutella rhossiliensis TaxID=111463 RepID=A0A9P8MWI2_9HYPO|nr:uncharacterized protein HRG_07757 [Hirsutella rhossiliensis]KAH0961679.1 hypothetical protein HRG_07757 [Hirsutella rhossiliensis]